MLPDIRHGVAKFRFDNKLLILSNSQDGWQVIQDDQANYDTVPVVDQDKMPLLVYVSREKRPSHPHHFKAGALNVLV
jgi:hypothetical protein